MGEDSEEFQENLSKMFAGNKLSSSDEELALHIYHRFNICRDTLESMPAFEEHLKTFFSKNREK